MIHLKDLHYLSLQVGPPQWPPLRSICRQCCRRGQCQRGPEIVNFGCTEGCHTKKWGIKFSQGSNGTIRSILAMSYDVWRRCTMSPAFDQVFSDKQTNRESTYCKNKDNITITIDISQYQSLVYQVSKAKNTVRKSIILHWLQTWTQFF